VAGAQVASAVRLPTPGTRLGSATGCSADRLESCGRFTDVTEKPCHDQNAAFDALLRAAATTVKGLAAKLAYLRSTADGNEAWIIDEHEGGGSLLLIDSITASLRNLGVLSGRASPKQDRCSPRRRRSHV
jgi:hypothetical protein